MFITFATTVGPVMSIAATDEELLRRIAARDERAFAELYKRHAESAHATARRVCRSRDMADDATLGTVRGRTRLALRRLAGDRTVVH